MGEYLFTVITTTLNVGSQINIAAASVREQNRTDVEYIVIDGGSTDDTLAHIRANGDVVTAYVSEKDSGIYDAINKGVRLATGRMVVVLGVDDRLAPGSLDALAERFARQEADIYVGSTRFVGGDQDGQLRVDEDFGLSNLVSGIPFCHNAMFVRREVYDRVGLYDTSYRLCADAQWVHRAVRAGLKCARLDQVVVEFSLDGASSTNPDKIIAESSMLIRESFPGLTDAEAWRTLSAVRGWVPETELVPLATRLCDPLYTRAVGEALANRGVSPSSIAGLPTLAPLPPMEEVVAETEPFFSIIMPAYNVTGYIAETLESLLKQSFCNIEIIIVDDGSTDGTDMVIARYAAADRRIRTHYQPNGGQGAARNHGLGMARGQYVWFVDSDDIVQTNALAKLHSTIVKHDPDIVVVNFAHYFADGGFRPSDQVPGYLASTLIEPRADENAFAVVSCWNCPPWRYVISRQLLIDGEIVFPKDIFYEDHPFALTLMSLADRVYIDPSIAYFYRHRPGSTVNVNDAKVFDFISIRRECLKLLARFGLLRRFPNITASYVLPASFIHGHVPEEYRQAFLKRLFTDIQLEELSIALGTDHVDGALFFSACEQYAPGLLARARSLCESLLSTTSTALLANSRSIREDEIEGLSYYEGAYPEQGWPTVFAWSLGKALTIRPRRGIRRPLRLELGFRNPSDKQIIRILSNGQLLTTLELASADMATTRCLKVDIPHAGISPPTIIVETLVNEVTPTRRLGIAVEAIDIVEADSAHRLGELENRVIGGGGQRLVVGARSITEGLNLDIRVNPQDRTYVTIGDDSQVSGHFVFERGLGTMSIGDRSSVGYGCQFICAQPDGIHIGSNVMLSWNVTLMDNDAHSLDPDVRANDAFDWLQGVKAERQGCLKDWSNVAMAPIRVEDNAWIGFGAVLLKGVTVGRGAVIGSRSVVSRSVAPFNIAAGNPARFIRLTPRQNWTWHDLLDAMPGDPNWRERLKTQGLGPATPDALKHFLASSTGLELRTAAGAPRSRILDLSGGRHQAGAALASLGHTLLVTAPDAWNSVTNEQLGEWFSRFKTSTAAPNWIDWEKLNRLGDTPFDLILLDRSRLRSKEVLARGDLWRTLLSVGGRLAVIDSGRADPGLIEEALGDRLTIPPRLDDQAWTAALKKAGLVAASPHNGVTMLAPATTKPSATSGKSAKGALVGVGADRQGHHGR